MGNDIDYKEMITHYKALQKTYLDIGIPIILTEIVVLTEEKKELESMKKYLFAVFSMSGSYNGILSYLMDNSVKNKG